MARSNLVILVLLLAAAGAWLAVWMRRRQQGRPVGSEAPPRRLPANMFCDQEPPASARGLCEIGARALDAHLALFARHDAGICLVSHAPRRPRLEILDKVAAEWALAHCVPTGRGTGLMTASEWQFQPVFRQGQLLGLLAIAGRAGREPVVEGKEWLLEDVLRHAGMVLAGLRGAPSKPLERPLLFT